MTKTESKDRGKNNFAVLSAIITTERDGYFGFAEVIFPAILKDLKLHTALPMKTWDSHKKHKKAQKGK